jgi:hypothetical protein
MPKTRKFPLPPSDGGFLISKEMESFIKAYMASPVPSYSSYRFKEKLTGHALEEWCQTFINDGSARLSVALNHATRPERLES